MRSKVYTAKRLPHARKALGGMTEIMRLVYATIFDLRQAGDERAATGIERAALRFSDWRKKVEESVTQSTERQEGGPK